MGQITLQGVQKSFGPVHIIKGADLDIADGSFVVFVGPSGCGKTTLLRLIAGLEDVTGGAILIDGKNVVDVPPAKRGLSMVFQSYALYPHMSVRGNIAFGLETAGMKKHEIQPRVEKAAEVLQITQLLQRKPKQLSGGQRQRVAIGRAIVREPNIFLFDEPLSNLDAELRVQMRVEIARLHQRLGNTMIYVTHDQTEAMTMASRIGVIEGGALLQIGTPREIYENPINAHVAARLGQPAINLLPAAIFAGAPPSAATIGARTEHLTIARGGGDVSATVKRIEHLGDQSHLHLDLGGRPVVTLSDPEARLGAGDVVSLHLNNPLFFDAAGRRIAA